MRQNHCLEHGAEAPDLPWLAACSVPPMTVSCSCFMTKRHPRPPAGLPLCQTPATELLQNPTFWCLKGWSCFWGPVSFLAFSASSWPQTLYTVQAATEVQYLSQGFRFLELPFCFSENMWHLRVNTATHAHRLCTHLINTLLLLLNYERSHKSLEVIFESIYLQLTVIAFTSRIVRC